MLGRESARAPYRTQRPAACIGRLRRRIFSIERPDVEAAEAEPARCEGGTEQTLQLLEGIRPFVDAEVDRLHPCLTKPRHAHVVERLLAGLANHSCGLDRDRVRHRPQRIARLPVPEDSRMTISLGSTSDRGRSDSPPTSRRSISTAVRPISLIGTRTVVSAGLVWLARG